MDVTDEIVENACQLWCKNTGFDYPRDIMRALLVAALADVPEPSPLQAVLNEGEREEMEDMRAWIGSRDEATDAKVRTDARVREPEEEREHAGIRLRVRDERIAELEAQLADVRAKFEGYTTHTVEVYVEDILAILDR